MTVISYPIPAYSNVPIEPQFYQPRRFVISDISLGATTTVTTETDHDYVVGQLVKLLIPKLYGAQQLNDVVGYVISVPNDDEVVINYNSIGFNSFITNPITATITGATRNSPCVLTANNYFRPGQYIRITGVAGMTELNNNNYFILSSNATTITIQENSISFSNYTSGGTATLLNYVTTEPEIISVGDINQGVTNTTGRTDTGTYIPGSFINISPA